MRFGGRGSYRPFLTSASAGKGWHYRPGVSEAERRAFVCPPASGEIDGIDLAMLDPSNEDERRILIESEHPEMRRALDDGRDLHVGSEVINPRLHIAMHEIVANQIWADDPPEVWRTAERLLAGGRDRHEILHMLASVMSDQVWGSMTKGESFDMDRVRLELAALPESWEADRDTWPAERSRNRAQRRAEERRHKT